MKNCFFADRTKSCYNYRQCAMPKGFWCYDFCATQGERMFDELTTRDWRKSDGHLDFPFVLKCLAIKVFVSN